MSYYKEHAKEYIDSTLNADMSKQYLFFEKHLKTKGTILDIGFGSGRDSLYFNSKGYDVTSIDPEQQFVGHGIALGLKKVFCMKAEDMCFSDSFDGIWACASLLHVNKKDLKGVFRRCAEALKENGVMYVSFKHGAFEGMQDGRYFVYLTKESLRSVLRNTGLIIKEIEITKDVRPGNNTEWLNVILVKRNIVQRTTGLKQKRSSDADFSFNLLTLDMSHFDLMQKEWLGAVRDSRTRKSWKLQKTENKDLYYSLVSEKSIKRNTNFIIDFVMYTYAYRRIIRDLQKDYDNPLIHTEKSDTALDEHKQITVILSSPNIPSISDTDSFNWNGRCHISRLDGFVPNDYEGNNLLLYVDVLVEGIRVTRLKTTINLSKNESGSLVFTQDRVRKIFFSYSSSDRSKVLKIVKKIKKVYPYQIDYFLDVLSLRAGDRWEQRIFEEIDDKDTFCLVWSKHAYKSEWVDKEWRYALKTKGLNVFSPINLDADNKSAPIPEELRSLHFAYYPLMFKK